ncbi:predicted protein [Sclerotinia sclerotiorum 1980 UF-70]|uniref:Uncharacterized protein n=1 Tax=Sclerotinia sclerotiorum (strain ATCC 18683 / 1980 / Ss-1) TaxID=665079 RepID=A7F5Y3_SCLS1|nr:predicted protein [Sclerotinia sclerotiorum 1980 UF-70]EDN98154.1 predicted protein [Sclerotinia sclerotiorum 1980 UF-70]
MPTFAVGRGSIDRLWDMCGALPLKIVLSGIRYGGSSSPSHLYLHTPFLQWKLDEDGSTVDLQCGEGDHMVYFVAARSTYSAVDNATSMDRQINFNF